MILRIDQASPDPVYLQIRDQIVAAIARGELLPADRLPSVRALASDLGINLHTVNKAYAVLRDEGYLLMRGRSGAVVADYQQAASAERKAASAEKIASELYRLALEHCAQGGTEEAFLEEARAQADRRVRRPGRGGRAPRRGRARPRRRRREDRREGREPQRDGRRRPAEGVRPMIAIATVGMFASMELALGLLLVFTPYLMRSNECFAVTVPSSAQKDPRLIALKKRYATTMLALTAALTLVAGGAGSSWRGRGSRAAPWRPWVPGWNAPPSSPSPPSPSRSCCATAAR